MKTTQYLLIGGGLASSQAARQLRKKDPRSSISLVGEEPYPPYDRPPLSKEFLRGEKTREELFYEPEKYFLENSIDLFLGVSVQEMDLSRKIAKLSDNETVAFEKALIATGGRPVKLQIPGHNLPHICYLRTLDDSLSIAAEIGKGKRAVIIGGGFIGMEIAASLTLRGVQVIVLEVQHHIWPRFLNATLAGFFQDYCTQKGVTFLTNEKALEIRGFNHLVSVLTESGKELPCDFVCVGIGILPNIELAQKSGLEVSNGIVVNEYLQSSHPDIYAAGDVVNYLDPVFNKRRRVEHWGHAEYCGQLAAGNMAGEKNKYDLLTYVWSDIFDLHLEFAGDESEHDQVLIRGSLEEKSFTLLYLKQKVLTAYFAINAVLKELPALQRLIREKKDLTSKENCLQDSAFAIKELL